MESSLRLVTCCTFCKHFSLCVLCMCVCVCVCMCVCVGLLGVCPEEDIDTPQGRFIWPKTNSGAASVLQCPVRVEGSDAALATRRCSSAPRNGSSLVDTVWSSANITFCPYRSPTTRVLQVLSQVSSYNLCLSSGSSFVFLYPLPGSNFLAARL